MSRFKQKILTLALVAVLITLFSQSTLAYYTVIGKATNVVTSGDIELKIVEKGADGKDFPADGVQIAPGDTIVKRVWIGNTGSHPFWLRVKITTVSDSKTLTPDQILESIDLNTAYWTPREDGYIYYHAVLEPGKSTQPLFTEVTFAGPLLDQNNIGTKLDLTVTAYAVQSENNPAANPWEASGWPAA